MPGQLESYGTAIYWVNDGKIRPGRPNGPRNKQPRKEVPDKIQRKLPGRVVSLPSSSTPSDGICHLRLCTCRRCIEDRQKARKRRCRQCAELNHRGHEKNLAFFFDEGKGYLFVKFLGNPSEGQVMLVRSLADHQLYVRKVCWPRFDNALYDKQGDELTLYRPHEQTPAIIQSKTLFGTAKDVPEFRHVQAELRCTAVVYQYCNGGDLRDLAFQPDRIVPSALLWHLFEQLLTVLHYLHYECSDPIAHQDVHPRNVFLDWLDYDGLPEVFLGDFGVATKISFEGLKTKAAFLMHTAVRNDYLQLEQLMKDTVHAQQHLGKGIPADLMQLMDSFHNAIAGRHEDVERGQEAFERIKHHITCVLHSVRRASKTDIAAFRADPDESLKIRKTPRPVLHDNTRDMLAGTCPIGPFKIVEVDPITLEIERVRRAIADKEGMGLAVKAMGRFTTSDVGRTMTAQSTAKGRTVRGGMTYQTLKRMKTSRVLQRTLKNAGTSARQTLQVLMTATARQSTLDERTPARQTLKVLKTATARQSTWNGRTSARRTPTGRLTGLARVTHTDAQTTPRPRPSANALVRELVPRKWPWGDYDKAMLSHCPQSITELRNAREQATDHAPSTMTANMGRQETTMTKRTTGQQRTKAATMRWSEHSAMVTNRSTSTMSAGKQQTRKSTAMNMTTTTLGARMYKSLTKRATGRGRVSR